MNRLTKKGLNYIKLYVELSMKNNRELGRGIEYARADKLQKLENIEESLGCSLEVVFKALENGIYIENLFGKMVNFKCRLTYKNEEIGWYFNIIDGYVLIKDYKKTWWLKDDLEAIENERY